MTTVELKVSQLKFGDVRVVLENEVYFFRCNNCNERCDPVKPFFEESLGTAYCRICTPLPKEEFPG